MNSTADSGTSRFKKVLFVEILIAAIIIIVLIANRTPTKSAAPSPTPTLTQQSNLVDGCNSVVSASTSNEQWTSAPALDLKDERKYWVLDTNCGEVVIEVYPLKAPVSVNSQKFLTEQNFFDGTPCHRLTTQGIFVIQCGDPLGSGIGNPGYTLPEENLPESAANNYPAGTVALAKSSQPNTSGAQFFVAYKDTTLGADYTIFGKVVRGLAIFENIAAAGTLNGLTDGKPLQNFGIVDAKFVLKLPK